MHILNRPARPLVPPSMKISMADRAEGAMWGQGCLLRGNSNAVMYRDRRGGVGVMISTTQATQGRKFSQPGKSLLAEPCSYRYGANTKILITTTGTIVPHVTHMAHTGVKFCNCNASLAWLPRYPVSETIGNPGVVLHPPVIRKWSMN